MQKSNTVFYIVIVLVIVVVGGAMVYSQKMAQSKVAMNKKTETSAKGEESMMKTSSGATILAGKSAPYIDFEKSEYEAALASGKVVFLDFYANWCPICRAEEPILKAGFDGLTSDKIIGFRVNYNDDQTDETEKKLAEQFAVPYQHYKVILQNGKTVFTSGDSWDAEAFNQAVSKFL